MERLKITPEDASNLLRRSSQQLNIKLREVAHNLTDTGQFAITKPPATPTKQNGPSHTLESPPNTTAVTCLAFPDFRGA